MKTDPNGYYVNQHSCFLLQYDLVIVTKYSQPVITGRLREALIQYTKNYFSARGCHLVEMNTAFDYIHILFDAPPMIDLAGFVNAYKSASSRRMRTDFKEELAPYYEKPYFWSMSYFIATASDRATSIMSAYIKQQCEKERRAFTHA